MEENSVMSKDEIIKITVENLKEMLPVAILADNQLGYALAISIRNLEVALHIEDENKVVTEDDA